MSRGFTSGAVIALTLAIAFQLASAQSALAGTYEVHSCDAAGGANRAWLPQAGSPALFASRQRCPALGTYDGFGMRSSTLSLSAGQLAGSWWRFDPPSGTTLEAIEWAGHYATSAPGWIARIETSRGTVAGCGPSARRCERTWAHGAKPARYELHGAGWIRVGAACLLATGCRTGDGRTTPYVDASTWFAKVIVRDPAGPRLQVGGVEGDRWVRPGTPVTLAATDPSGISRIDLEADSGAIGSARFDCDRTRTSPCSDHSASFTLPASLPDGRRTLTAVAVDAAANSTERDLLIGVDGHAPRATVAPSVDGGQGWRASPRFTLRWELPDQGEASPIAKTKLRICERDDGDAPVRCLVDREIIAEMPQAAEVELPREGEWEARVLFEDAAGNIDGQELSPPVPLRWDRATPGPGAILLPDRWIGRDAARNLSLKLDPPGVGDRPRSGVAGWAYARGALPGVSVDLEGESPSVPLDDFPEGVTEVAARPISHTGVAAVAVATARVRIDETPPELLIEDPTSGGWATGPVEVKVTARDQAWLSGMSTGGGSAAAVRISVDGQHEEEAAGDEAAVEVTGDGLHSVTVEATDAAGNSSGRRSLTVRIDSTPPERLSFLPQDSADPRIVRVDALDAGSGLGEVSVRMRPVAGGEWANLSGEMREGRFEAVVDEAGLKEGLWEMEATALDRAGNSKRATRTIAGDLAVIAIPLRGPTRIDAGFARASSGAAQAVTAMTVAHGASSEVVGRLLDAFEQPVAGALLTLSSSPMMVSGEWAAGGHATTDRLGRFRFRLPPGPSRRLRVAFAGDHGGMPTSLGMTLRVPASTTIGARPGVVRAGTTTTFSGRLSGGWIPSGGKMVMVQALIPAHGWQTFAVARSNPGGEWATRYRFRSAVGRTGHLIRAIVPTESGYPFERFTTAPIRVRGAR